MRAVFLALLAVLGPCSVSSTADIITGCSSRCSLLFDKDLTCFNSSLNYYQQVLMGTMRNYIASQVNIKNSAPNTVQPTSDQLVQQTIDQMNNVKIANVEAEKDVFSTAEARPIVQALVDNFEALGPKPNQAIYCPIGCEKSRSPFDWLFYISIGVNGLLILVGGAALVIRAIKEEMFGRRKVAHIEHFITEHNKKRATSEVNHDD